MLWLFHYIQQFKQFIIWAWSCFHHIIFFYHFLGGNICITHWKKTTQLLNKPFIKRYHVPRLVVIVSWELVYETNVNAGKDTNITCILSKKIWSQKKIRPPNWTLRFAALIKGRVYRYIQNYKRFSIEVLQIKINSTE